MLRKALVLKLEFLHGRVLCSRQFEEWYYLLAFAELHQTRFTFADNTITEHRFLSISLVTQSISACVSCYEGVFQQCNTAYKFYVDETWGCEVYPWASRWNYETLTAMLWRRNIYGTQLQAVFFNENIGWQHRGKRTDDNVYRYTDTSFAELPNMTLMLDCKESNQ